MEDKNKKIVVNFLYELLDLYEFELYVTTNEKNEKVYMLKDLQDANLGGIEQDCFFSLSDVLDRLEIYHIDYIYTPLEDRIEAKEIIPKDDWDIVAKRFIESDFISKILNEISPTEYEELQNNLPSFETSETLKILDSEEQFYKIISEKYISTMSKEMLLEIDNKIIHFFIEDEYIDLKQNGEINAQNYKKYLDSNFNIYEYGSYQQLYKSTIEDEILNDINDLGLFNDNGEWNFYITFEELKTLEYGYKVQYNYPLLEKYITGNREDFYKYFSLEQLDDFEQSLDLYFNEKDIIYNEVVGLYSKNDLVFNKDIIRLACGLTTYEDFIKDYEDYTPSYFDLSLLKVREYFEENQIKDLMDYGSDTDEGLSKLSSLYKEIMDKLDIKYENIYTEDVSDGKYLTTIIFEDNSKIELDTSAWNGIRVVTENIESIYATYENLKEKSNQNNKEIDYDYE